MPKPLELLRRIRMLFHRNRFQSDLEEEMRLHLDLREQEQREAGLSRQEAHQAAYRRFGNPTAIKEKSHTTWGWDWLEAVLRVFLTCVFCDLWIGTQGPCHLHLSVRRALGGD